MNSTFSIFRSLYEMIETKQRIVHIPFDMICLIYLKLTKLTNETPSYKGTLSHQ